MRLRRRRRRRRCRRRRRRRCRLFHVIVLPICSLIWCYILEPYCS